MKAQEYSCDLSQVGNRLELNPVGAHANFS